MAIVSFTAYHGRADCGRTNAYISDGHGLPPAQRTNRYLSDGHGGHTACAAVHCPAVPELATAYMALVEKNYERQHIVSPGRTKKPVTYYQIYVSPTEKDNVPAQERVEMTLELIQRTKLRDFPSLIAPHDNTPDKHCHISLCPFSIDGTHKLGMNNALICELRREMDRICVEHGYSIIENRELWGDKAYYAWFQEVKARGIVTVHPPKEQDMTTFKKDRKRSRTYARIKEKESEEQKRNEEYIHRMIVHKQDGYTAYTYTSPIYYNPKNPRNPLTIRTVTKEGRTLSELEQLAIAQAAWAYNCSKELVRRKITGCGHIQKRLQTIQKKALAAARLFRDLDIRDHEELIRHIKEVGCDIASFKIEIKKQEAILTKDPDNAYARKRLEKAKELLAARSCEYHKLKAAEAVLHPAACKDEWEAYLSATLKKEAAAKIGRMSPERMEEEIRQMGKTLGLDHAEIEKLIEEARETAGQTTWVEYSKFMYDTFYQDERKIITGTYDVIGSLYSQIRQLRRNANAVPVLGLFTFCLSLLIAIRAEYKIILLEREIESMKWDLEKQKLCFQPIRRTFQAQIEEAKAIYDAQVTNSSQEEIQAAQVRYYETIAHILGRNDILEQIYQQQMAGDLDSRIAEAARKNLTPETQLPQKTKGTRSR